MSQQMLPEDDLAHILQHAAAALEDMRGQAVFITGGTGFFGRWLLESIAYANDHLALGVKACILTRNPAAFAQKAPHLTSRSDLTFHEGDLRNFIFPAGEFTRIIHAGTTAAEIVEPWDILNTILGGTQRVLEFAGVCGVNKLLFTSSGAIYGPQPADITHVPEDFQGAPNCIQPSSAYGEGKRAAELLCILAGARYGFETKIARCFSFVGPHLPLTAHFAIGNFIRDSLAGKDIQIAGDGQPYRSYLHAADLTVWLWTLLSHGISARPYNVGSAQDYSISEVAHAVREANGGRLSINVAKTPAPGQPRIGYVPCIQRAESELGLRAHIPLLDAIRRTLAWYSRTSSS